MGPFRLVLLAFLVGCLGGVLSCGGSGLGEVQVLKGKATITSGEKSTAVSKGKTAALTCGDTVATDEGSHALVRAGKQSYVLGEETAVRIDLASSTADNGPRKITVTKGSVTVRMPDISEESKFPKLQVVGDACSVGARGGVFDVAVKPGAGTTVAVLKGHVELYPATAEIVGGIAPDGKGVKNPKQLPAALGTVDEEKQLVMTGGAPGTAKEIPEDALKRIQENAKK